MVHKKDRPSVYYIVITFAGFAVSQPLSFQYRYSANVATGAIELSDQRSGVQLVADVHVSVSADMKKATIQVTGGTRFLYSI